MFQTSLKADVILKTQHMLKFTGEKIVWTNMYRKTKQQQLADTRKDG